MTAQEQVIRLLREFGFVLARTKKHHVYKHVDGRAWTVPKTVSDSHSWANNLSTLKRFLERGVVRVAPPANGNHCTEFLDQLLRPERVRSPKPVRERSLGTLLHRVKIPQVIPIRQTEKHHELPLADIYEVGSFLHAVMRSLIQEVEADARVELLKRTEAFLESQWEKTAKQDCNGDKQDRQWLAYVDQERANMERYIQERTRMYARASLIAIRLFQKMTRLARKNEPIEKNRVKQELIVKFTVAKIPERVIEPLAAVFTVTGILAIERAKTLKQGEKPTVVMIVKKDQSFCVSR